MLSSRELVDAPPSEFSFVYNVFVAFVCTSAAPLITLRHNESIGQWFGPDTANGVEHLEPLRLLHQ